MSKLPYSSETINEQEHDLLTAFRQLPPELQKLLVVSAKRNMNDLRNGFQWRAINILQRDGLVIGDIMDKLYLTAEETDAILAAERRYGEIRKLKKTAEALERNNRHIMRLRYENGYSIKTIAEMCNTVVDSVLNTLGICRKTSTMPISNEGMFIDDRDGQSYRTVKIGQQLWMAENLRYKTDNSWYCNKDENTYSTYGMLYPWNAAKKVSPRGWHLPGLGEWRELIDFVGDRDIAGRKLKAMSKWDNVADSIGNGTDDYSFAALPAGYRTYRRSFQGFGSSCIFWTNTSDNFMYQIPCERAHVFCIDCRDAIIDGVEHKKNAFSVRCVADESY